MAWLGQRAVINQQLAGSAKNMAQTLRVKQTLPTVQERKQYITLF